MKRPKKPPPPPVLEPWACVILAIDPGRSSGWAVFDAGKLVASGHALTQEERAGACLLAEVTAGGRGAKAAVPLVVVAEKWTASRSKARDKRMNPSTLAGLGRSWGMWLAAIETELQIPKKRVLRVAQGRWKAKVLGRASMAHKQAVATMASVAVRAGAKAGAVEDVYAAVCIGIWAARSGEVGAVLPRPRAPRMVKPRASSAQKGRAA